MSTAELPGFPHFKRSDWFAIIAVGVLTPLIDSRVEVLLIQFFYEFRNVVNIFSITGGPVNSDLLVAWEEYGAVLASYLVRKPGAATIAMTVNGFGQYIVDGFQGPHHLLYGISGVGADVTFALFRYKRYDIRVCALAGVASQFFWVPVTYVYHAVYVLPLSFIEVDLLVRLVGGAVADGLMGAGLGLVILFVARHARTNLASGAARPQASAV